MLGLVSSAVGVCGEADTTLVVNCVAVVDWGVKVRVFSVDDAAELRVVCKALVVVGVTPVVPDEIVASPRTVSVRRESRTVVRCIAAGMLREEATGSQSYQ